MKRLYLIGLIFFFAANITAENTDFFGARVENVAKGGQTAFRSFTSSNFRYNLGKMTGNIPANSHAHHVFPQAFRKEFLRAGININDPRFGVWWNSTSHLQNATSYNAAWRRFFMLNPNPTEVQILNHGRQLMLQHGIPVGF